MTGNENGADAAIPGVGRRSVIGAVRDRVLASSFSRQVCAMGCGSVLGQIIYLVLAPILTRLYGPFPTGQVNLLVAFVSIASVAASLRYETAIVSAESEEEAASLTVCLIPIIVVLSVVSGVVLQVFRNCDWVRFGQLPPWIGLFGGALVCGVTLISTLRFYLVRHQEFQVIARVVVVQSAGRAILPIPLFHFGFLGLALGEALGRVMGLATMARSTYRHAYTGIRGVTRDTVKAALLRNWKSPAVFMPASVLNAVSDQMSILLVASYFGLLNNGLFGFALKVLMLPAGFVSASIADVFHSHAADKATGEPGDLLSFMRRTVRWILIGGLPAAVLVMVLAPILFGRLFGAQWTTAGAIASAMTPYVLASMVVSPVTRVVLVLGRQEATLLYNVVSLGLTFVSIAGGKAIGLSMLHSVILWSALQTLCYVFYYWMLYRLCSKHAVSLAANVPEAP